MLDAALAIYLEEGFERTSMDAIAAAAGVTKPVLYDCFPSKRALFRALEEREERRLLRALDAALPARIDLSDPQRVLTDGFTAFFSAVQSAPDAYRLILLWEQGTAPGPARRGNEMRAAHAERIAVVVRAWLARQGVTELEPIARMIGHAIVGMGEALGRLMIAEPGQWDPEVLGATVGAVLMHGVAGLARPE